MRVFHVYVVGSLIIVFGLLVDRHVFSGILRVAMRC